MASNYSSSYITHPLKSNCSPSYGSIGNNMGVLVTGPWPMSQQTSSASYATLNSKGSSSTYESSCRQRRASYHQGHNHLRPISMPTSSSSNRDSTCCRYESAIEMVPLNINAGGVVVPCRNGGAGDGGMMMMSNPTSPPTCVPWLKKMKVIKKIQRKIGIGGLLFLSFYITAKFPVIYLCSLFFGKCLWEMLRCVFPVVSFCYCFWSGWLVLVIERGVGKCSPMDGWMVVGLINPCVHTNVKGWVKKS